jgi:hypothetical protein
MTKANGYTNNMRKQPQAPSLVGGKGLGRQYAPDQRDRRFLLTAKRLEEIPRAVDVRRRSRPWHIGPILDQGATNQCTVYAAVQQIQSAPRIHDLHWTPAQFAEVYQRALLLDEFPGEIDEGTSERAVQKALQERKLIDSYLWATEEDVAREYLLTRGMLCFGTDWFQGFDSPGKKSYVDPTGRVRGGHEYVMRWYYGARHYKYPDTYEFVNSWGPSFGESGIFRMKADVVRYLWFQLNGDLASPVEPKH